MRSVSTERAFGFRHPGALAWVLIGLSVLGFSRTIEPVKASTPPPDPPTTVDSRLRLDLLADDETVLFLSLNPGAWFVPAPEDPGSNLVGAAILHAMGQVEDHLDPRARGLWRLLSSPKVVQAGLALWPPQEAAGTRHPVWLIGFESVPSISGEEIFQMFKEAADTREESLQHSSFLGIRILRVPHSGGTLQVAVDGNRVVFGTSQKLLEGYLAALEGPRISQVVLAPRFHLQWRPDWDHRDTSPLLGFLRRGLGADWLGLRADGDGDTTRLVVEVQRLPGLVPPLGPAQPLDTHLLSAVPKNADVVLVSGGIESASAPPSTGTGGGTRPGWTRLLGQPFAFGAEILEVTKSGQSPLRISGVYRDPDQVYLDRSDDITRFIRDRFDPEPSEESQTLWGGVPLDRYAREEWVFLSNTEELLGSEAVPKIQAGFPVVPEFGRPLVAGRLGALALWGPLQRVLSTAPAEIRDNLAVLVAGLRIQLNRVDFSLFEDPDRWCLVLESADWGSAAVALLDFFVVLDILSLGGPSSLVDTVMGGMDAN